MRVAASAKPIVIALAIVMAILAYPAKAADWSAGPGASWQGFYVGGNLGEALAASSASTISAAMDSR
jgi:hypothetical protein